MRKQVFSLLVNNNAGLLSRVAGLFSRRGYSIDSITAGITTDERFTRLTVVASGDELILSQIEKQLRNWKMSLILRFWRMESRFAGSLLWSK